MIGMLRFEDAVYIKHKVLPYLHKGDWIRIVNNGLTPSFTLHIHFNSMPSKVATSILFKELMYV